MDRTWPQHARWCRSFAMQCSHKSPRMITQASPFVSGSMHLSLMARARPFVAIETPRPAVAPRTARPISMRPVCRCSSVEEVLVSTVHIYSPCCWLSQAAWTLCSVTATEHAITI